MKKCKVCKTSFQPASSMHSVCSHECAVKQQEAIREKNKKLAVKLERRETKAKLEKLLPISVFEKRAEKVVNAYVRARDARFGHGCVSCEKPANWDGQWHASHFRSVGAASSVRFNLWNIHRACWICNKLYSGRIADYEPVLIQRIGQEKVDWLKSQNKITRYSREYLQRLQTVFAKKTRRMLSRPQYCIKITCNIEGLYGLQN